VSDAKIVSPTARKGRVLFASLIGTTIEFYDFYIYATAAVLVFPKLFFPGADPTTAMLSSFATFSIAFFARPVGALAFGHFGDRVGRKATLVAALMTMGVSTVAIGLLPTHASVGIIAPLFGAGLTGLLIFFALGFGLMGCTYGPIGAAMARPFPTTVRYTGASMAFNLAGIVGASLAPYLATWLAQNYGLAAVGGYLALSAVVTILALWGMGRVSPETEL